MAESWPGRKPPNPQKAPKQHGKRPPSPKGVPKQHGRMPKSPPAHKSSGKSSSTAGSPAISILAYGLVAIPALVIAGLGYWIAEGHGLF